MRSIFRKLCVRLFTLCKISTAIFESSGAIYRQICEMFSALQNASGPVTDVKKQRPNRCIIGDVFLPETGTKLTKNAVLNLALCCGANWRHREKSQYRCTITTILLYTTAKKDFEKFTSCMTFGAHSLVHSEPFFGLLIRNLTLAVIAR